MSSNESISAGTNISTYGAKYLAVLIPIAILAAIKPIFALIGLLVIVGAFLAMAKPHWVTYLFIASFPFIAHLPRGTYIPVLKLDEVLIILGFLVWVFSPISPKRLTLSKIDLIFILLIFVGAILPVIGQRLRGWQTEWIELIAITKGYLIYRLILFAVSTREQAQKIVILLLVPICFVFMIALLQMLNIFNMREILANVYGGSGLYVQNAGNLGIYFRATSTLGNWNALGSYATFGALLSVALMIYQSKNNRNNYYLLVPVFASCLGILILAGSSSSIIGFLLGVLGLAFSEMKKINIRRIIKFLLPVIVVVYIVFIYLGQQVLQIQINRQANEVLFFRPTGEFVNTYGLPASLAIRGHLAYYLFGVMKADGIALLTGFGEGQLARDMLSWSTAESGYMSMLFYYGPLYLITYLVLLITIFSYLKRIKRQINRQFTTVLALIVAAAYATAAMGVMNIISSYYTAAGSSHFFWILIAIAIGVSRITDSTLDDNAISNIPIEQGSFD
jgi:hypothetical protein